MKSRILKTSLAYFLSLVLIFNVTISGAVSRFDTEPPKSYEYDPVFDVNDPFDRELIDLLAEFPDMPGVSKEVMGMQKFRPFFGPTFWRLLTCKDCIKILFIGQDATHIAEAAGRTATASFGGTAQMMAEYLGVRYSAGFLNAYASTIKGQYGTAATPYFKSDTEIGVDAKGYQIINPNISQTPNATGKYVSNELWLMSNDLDSPIVQWRNKLFELLIKRNQGSLQMVVPLGAAAKDAWGVFLTSLAEKNPGLQVGTRMSGQKVNDQGKIMGEDKTTENMKKIKMPYLEIVPDGGNAEKAVIQKIDGKIPLNQGGPYGNGLLHPGQFGLDLDLISRDGGKTATRDMQGIKLSDGTPIKNQVLIWDAPHPTALSASEREERGSAAKKVMSLLKTLDPYVKNGYKIIPDAGLVNEFAAGKPFVYGKADSLPANHYDHGTPNARMVKTSSASRMSGKPHIIVFGTRDRVEFDTAALEAAVVAKPADPISANELFVTKPRTEETRYLFDSGPGLKYAQIMEASLDFETVTQPKDGMNFKEHGIDAYNIKSHPTEVGAFGYYRGTFEGPKVFILADPDGFDDMSTSRALTGTRGQYLQGMMNDLGVKDKHLILKTVPFGMDGASGAEWKTVLAQTQDYREQVLMNILADNATSITMLVADGENAAAELKRIVKKLKLTIPVVVIQKDGLANNSGIVEAQAQIAKIKTYAKKTISGKMADIPRSHLAPLARVWEGTGGDHVFAALASDKENRGVSFAFVAPRWAWTQKPIVSSRVSSGVKVLVQKLIANKMPAPGQKLAAFLKSLALKKSAGREKTQEKMSLVSALSSGGTNKCLVFYR